MSVTYINDEWELQYSLIDDIEEGAGYYWQHKMSGDTVGHYHDEDEANDAMENGEVYL